VIGILLGLMLVGETAFLLYVSIVAVFQIPPVLGTKGPCTATDKPGQHVVTGFWLAPVVFDLICTFLTMYKVSTQAFPISVWLETVLGYGYGEAPRGQKSHCQGLPTRGSSILLGKSRTRSSLLHGDLE